MLHYHMEYIYIYIGWQKLLQLKWLKIPGAGLPAGILLSGGVARRVFYILGSNRFERPLSVNPGLGRAGGLAGRWII